MFRSIVAASTVAVLTMGVSGAAAAAGPKRTELTLSYMAEAGYATAVRLWCEPARGVHPQRVKACRTLRNVDGRPSRIKPAHTMCILIYAPITAEVRGTWRGRPVRWSHTFGNSCEMTRATGVLFRF
jgi:Subtilisin inhibitor-like